MFIRKLTSIFIISHFIVNHRQIFLSSVRVMPVAGRTVEKGK